MQVFNSIQNLFREDMTHVDRYSAPSVTSYHSYQMRSYGYVLLRKKMLELNCNWFWRRIF